MLKYSPSAPRKLCVALCCFWAASAGANPHGFTVVRGSATANLIGSFLNLTVSGNAVLHWSSFNIGPGETTTFLQPNAHSVVWNNIGDANPSQILGNLNANGNVVLINPHGFYFGNQAVITARGFVAAATTVVREPGAGGMFWQFDGAPPSASIINYGQINAGPGGSVYLVADAVVNHGVIAAPDGTIGLYAGKEVLISERPDGRGISATVKLPAGSVDNTGTLIADAGTIMLKAAVVNQNGLIQAGSVRDNHGVIELVAGDSVTLGPSSVISAAGGGGVSSGGEVSIKSAGTFSDTGGSTIDVSGGAGGGDGGRVGLCADVMEAVASQIQAMARPGWHGGGLYIDPSFITLGTTGTGVVGAGGAVGYQSGSGTLALNVFSSFTGFSHIDLQASQDITLSRGTVWNLNSSTGVSTPGCTLTLEAGRNIIFSSGSSIVGGQGWSVEMIAGRDFTTALSPALSNPNQAPGLDGILAGVGGIYINGGPPAGATYPRLTGSLETADGSIDLRAGNEVVVGSGYIRTDNGGDISIATLSGSVDAGTSRNGYVYTPNGPVVSPAGISGIGTESGGDVTVNAGNQILSFVPTIGCYAAGNVNLTAGNSVLGNYQVANGSGVINAPQIGSPASPISLSLATGSWNATAVHGVAGALGDIYINEIFNPNGSLNSIRQQTGAGIPFQFNYAPDSSVTLTAGNSVELSGNSIAHTTSNPDLLPIYPPILNLTAGAGGVVLGNDVILYPSPQAGLNITTTHGGSLAGAGGNLFELVMSDSDSPVYSTFITGHSATPLQTPDASEPVQINVAGSIEDISLQIPKRAIINAGGDAINFYFTGQNLLPGDVTQLNVAGNIINQTGFSTVVVPGAPNLSIFDPYITTTPLLNLGGQLAYNAAARQLIFTGRMTAAQLAFLLHPTVFVFDQNGNQEIGANGQPVTQAVTFESAGVLQQLYNASLLTPSFPTSQGGLVCGGPGAFNISANNMDLGITAGVRSVLTGLNPNLALLYSQGADVNINLLGNLDVSSSQIASFNGGSITVNAGGKIDVGSQTSFTSDDTPKGIYTAGGGSVTVTAVGDVNVNGSRVATYDGGDVTITSTQGSVDAGNGGSGFFYVTTEQLDPGTGHLGLQEERFFGSGILALTAARSTAPVGNISVTAAQNISADSGGILQLAFNHAAANQATVNLHAGGNIEANQSGVLGENVALSAGGTISGLIIAHQNLNVNATGAVNITAVANGNVNVSSSASVSGSITGAGSVNVSGSSITAGVISTGGSTATSGDASGAKVGAFQGVAATSSEKTTQDADQTVAQNTDPTLTSDDDKKKRAKKPLLAKVTGRVTVILPKGP